MVARSDGQCHLFVSFRNACILHILPLKRVPQLPLNIGETPIELGHARAAPEPILLQSLRSLCNCLEVFWYQQRHVLSVNSGGRGFAFNPDQICVSATLDPHA